MSQNKRSLIARVCDIISGRSLRLRWKYLTLFHPKMLREKNLSKKYVGTFYDEVLALLLVHLVQACYVRLIYNGFYFVGLNIVMTHSLPTYFTLSLSLSLTHTYSYSHSHTHTLTLSLSVSVSVSSS